MSAGNGGYPILYDSRLMEEAVLLAESRLTALLRMRFRRGRDRLYETGNEEQRERAFELFHRRWFARLGLGDATAAILDEYETVKSSTRRCLVVPAAREEEEGADLRAESPPAGSRSETGSPTLIVQLRPGTLVVPESVARLLRHELLHVADMLDPRFGYAGMIPPLAGGPARLQQARERYRVLWDCTIDGRLHGRGCVGAPVRDLRRREFEAWFPDSGPAFEEGFRRWFDGPRPTHDEMVAAASRPAGAGSRETPAAGRGICPLCRFPSADLRRGATVSREVRELIRREFPVWRPLDGICLQCVDLYSARRAEAEARPAR